jgi:hypothetical protein
VILSKSLFSSIGCLQCLIIDNIANPSRVE